MRINAGGDILLCRGHETRHRRPFGGGFFYLNIIPITTIFLVGG